MIRSLQYLVTTYTPQDIIVKASSSVYDAVASGNRETAAYFVDILFKRGNFGYNHLHHQALTLDGKNFDDFKAVSVTKRATGNYGFTPVHCAAINPNPKYLKALVAASPSLDVSDDMGRHPV